MKIKFADNISIPKDKMEEEILLKLYENNIMLSMMNRILTYQLSKSEGGNEEAYKIMYEKFMKSSIDEFIVKNAEFKIINED